jgi:hypothetical protein
METTGVLFVEGFVTGVLVPFVVAFLVVKYLGRKGEKRW